MPHKTHLASPVEPINSPIRIAIVCEYPTLNGGERSLLAMLPHWAPAEFDVRVLAPGAGPLAEELRIRGIQHVPLELHTPSGVRLPRVECERRLLAALSRQQPGLVHANSLAMGRLTGAIADRIAAPCTSHLRDIVRLSRTAVSELNHNDRLIAVSHATRAFHVAQRIDPARVVVIHNGIDPCEFQPRPRSGWLREELGLPPAALLIATIGQIGLRKGQDVLAAAAAINAASHPDAHYLLVGERYSSKAESRAFEQNVVRQFADARIADRLHRLGYRRDVPRLLNEIDLLVHPARQEPLGRVLLEAAACGRPVVATDVGGTTEIFRDRESALLVPPDDASALAGSIRTILQDGALAARLGAAARNFTLSRFQVADRAAELARLWRTTAQTA
jgi:glycosyltransferase involved in cell wall biosynthesis